MSGLFLGRVASIAGYKATLAGPGQLPPAPGGADFRFIASSLFPP
jgi:hypothetical protein